MYCNGPGPLAARAASHHVVTRPPRPGLLRDERYGTREAVELLIFDHSNASDLFAAATRCDSSTAPWPLFPRSAAILSYPAIEN